ncbi:hypothetical protein [Paenisporosarcina sp. TG20]|uniref:hypothetical protein n=1 Tax=Paenisporosarcina sp. TG20 TaxID=1211706 RepID=UPI0002D6E1AA|nr:hypothetical protein [Paenisporosarcina sp. TG20]
MFNFHNSNITPIEFWKWFYRHENEYYNLSGNIEARFKSLAKKLARVHPDLTFEFSNELINGKREFTVSADGFKDAFPYVINLVGNSGLDERRWNLVDFKQRSGLSNVEHANVILKPENLYF